MFSVTGTHVVCAIGAHEITLVGRICGTININRIFKLMSEMNVL